MTTPDQRKVQLGVEVDASRARSGFDQVKAEAKDMATEVAKSGQQAGKGLDGIGSSGEAAAAKLDRDTRSMIASVQRTTAAMEAAGKGKAAYFEELSKQRGIDADALKPYLEELRKAESAQQAATGSLNKMGVSAAQTAAAMRQVPAQFTDIITSLQGGQAPLTVLLQQGGQLKDMFGGAGAAAKALGSYVAGLVSPLSLAVAGLGAVAYGYFSGRAESAAFNQAVITTGGAADVTAGQLTAMAASMAQVTGNQSKASDALVAFVQAGGVGAQQLQRFTEAALQMESVGGPAVAETAKAFAELAKSPMEATIKLNEAMNYLTAATYEQINSLDEQGKHTEAARLAQDAYARALEDRAPQMLQNLGLLEQAWLGIKRAISGAGSALASIGRGQTPQEQLAAVQASIANKTANAKSLQGGLLGAWLQSDIEQLREQESYLRERIRLEQRSADLRADQAAQTKAMIQWDKDGEQFLDKKLRMEREITKARNEGLAAKRSDAEIEERVKAIKDKFTDKTVAVKPFKYSDNGAERAYINALGEMDRIQRSATASAQDLSKTQEALRKVQDSPEWALFSRRKQEEIILAAASAQAAEDESDAHKLAEKALKEVSQAREADLRKLQSSATSANQKAQQIEDEVALYGMSEEAINALTIARLREEQAKQMSYGDDLAVKAIGDEIAALQRLAVAKDSLSAKDAAKKAADKAATDWARAAEKIQDSITDALMRGFESGKGFAENLRDTVVNMFKTMVLRPIVEFGVRGSLSVLGLGGASGAANAASTAAGIGNSASMLSTMAGWLTDFGGSMSSAISRLGYQIAGDTAGSWSNSAGSYLVNNADAIGSGLETIGNGLGYLNAAMAASEGQWGKAIGQGLGTYFFGPIGGAIGGALGSWVDNAFGGGHEYTVGTGISGRFSGNNFAGRNFQDWRNDGSSGFFGIGASGSSSGTNYSAMDATFQKSLGVAYGKLLDQTAGFATALGANAAAITGYQKDIKLSLGTDAEANKKAIANMFKGIADDVAAVVLDSRFMREGEGAADTLARLATNLTAVNGALDTLGDNLLSVSQYSGDVASALVDSFGGLQSYQSAIGAYYQRFYTQEERLAKTREQLTKQMADLGVSVPDSIEAFRSQVNAQDLSTEAGRKTYAALIGMSAAFSDITDAADAAQIKLSDVAKSLASLLQSVTSARDSVASARNEVSPAPVMDAAAIRAAVLAATSSASTSAMNAAASDLGQKTVAASQASTALASAQTTAEAKAAALASATTAKANTVAYYESKRMELQALARKYQGHENAGLLLSSAPGVNNDDAYKYNAASNRLNGFDHIYSWGWQETLKNGIFGSVSTTYNPDVAGFKADPAYKALNTVLGGGNTALAKAASDMALASTALVAAQSALTTATSNKATADAAAKAASVAYTQAVDAWTVEASKSVPQLTKLRDETLRYYEAQKALAEGMTTSAANLRTAVANARVSQLDPLTNSQQQLREFAKNYDLALSTSGAQKAAYADKLAAALPTLSEAIKATSSTGDWMTSMARLFAQSNAIADQLDASAPKDYQVESLALLDTIDSSLAILDDSTKAITRAIEASGGITAAGLRSVVTTLGGVPSFDVGTNYVPHDMFARIHEGEAIVPKVYNPFRPGAQGAGLGDTSRLEALVEQQAQQLAALRAELRAITIHTANTAENTRSMDKNGVLIWTDPAAPIGTKVVA